jgi:hypothetical protein
MSSSILTGDCSISTSSLTLPFLDSYWLAVPSLSKEYVFYFFCQRPSALLLDISIIILL